MWIRLFNTFVNRKLIFAALLVSLISLVASPAAAHDELWGQTPAADSIESFAPTEVTLTFSSEPLEIGSIIMVVDAAGNEWQSGEVVIQGSEVVQPLKPELPDGFYQVRWRVISNDGHPISGYFDFGVGSVSDADPLPELSSAPTTATDDQGAETTANEPSAFWSSPLWFGILGATTALALFVTIRFLITSRNKNMKGDHK